jgi:hypothetical protein
MNQCGNFEYMKLMRSEAMKIQPKLSYFRTVSVVFAVLVLGVAGPAKAGDTWQEKMLFDPSASQLELEKRGRVVIYDGLKDTQIMQAMDTQFDRIQSMMFVHTITTNAEGEILHDEETGTDVVEDDGC